MAPQHSPDPGDDARRSGRKRRVLDRVVTLRRTGPLEAPTLEPAADPGPPEGEELAPYLLRRIDELERALEGLQDAVHRESQRRDEELAALRRMVRPEEIARALSDDARRRGL